MAVDDNPQAEESFEEYEHFLEDYSHFAPPASDEVLQGTVLSVNAKEVILLGTVKGNIRAADRVEIRKSGSLVGDLLAARVIIEDGAYFKGGIDITQPKALAATASKS